MWSKLDGKKTFIVCLLGIVWAIAGAMLGYLPADEAVNIVLAALGGAGIREALRANE